jgi:hypothetical protein
MHQDAPDDRVPNFNYNCPIVKMYSTLTDAQRHCPQTMYLCPDWQIKIDISPPSVIHERTGMVVCTIPTRVENLQGILTYITVHTIYTNNWSERTSDDDSDERGLEKNRRAQ